MSNNGPTGWTPERTALLVMLHAEGLSFSQIAKRANELPGLKIITRNSAIGKAHRMGIGKRVRPSAATPREPSGQTRAPVVRKRKGAAEGANAKRIASIIRAPRQPLPVSLELAPVTARPWMQRKRYECAWPIGEGADCFSCCAPVLNGGSWCEAHRVLGHVAVPPKTGNQFVRSLRKFYA